MMGFANQSLKRSLDGVFFPAHGSECTLRRAEGEESCIVQFDNRERPVPFSGEVTVTGPDGSTALVKKTLGVRPDFGEVIVEADGTAHRISQVRDLGYAWECRCETNFSSE